MKIGKLSKNNRNTHKEERKQNYKRKIIIAVLIIIFPIVCYSVCFIVAMVELSIKEAANFRSFNKNITPKILAQIDDQKVRFHLYNFEEIMMPQFYIDYAPNLEIRFHTGWSPVEDKLIDHFPALSVSVKNTETKKTCGFDVHNQNYDFIKSKSELVSDKLLKLYDNRQQIIDDFVAQRPECFELLSE